MFQKLFRQKVLYLNYFLVIMISIVLFTFVVAAVIFPDSSVAVQCMEGQRSSVIGIDIPDTLENVECDALQSCSRVEAVVQAPIIGTKLGIVYEFMSIL